MGCVVRLPIVQECRGCKRVYEVNDTDGKGNAVVCRAYPNPAYWWKDGRQCPLASHVMEKPTTPAEKKKRIGQQKARKKARMSEKTRHTYTRIGGD